MEKLDELSHRMIQIRDERSLLRQQDKALTEEFETLGQNALGMMEELGCEATKTAYATMSVSRSIVANITDLEAFRRYVKENDAFFLYQNRINNKDWAATRELEPDGNIPGTEPFEKVGISVRKR